MPTSLYVDFEEEITKLSNVLKKNLFQKIITGDFQKPLGLREQDIILLEQINQMLENIAIWN